MKGKQNRENNYMGKRGDLPLTCGSFPFNINTWFVPAKQKKKNISVIEIMDRRRGENLLIYREA